MSLTELTKKYEETKKKFQEELSSELKKSFTKFFQENPKIYGIMWEQYTPHFNDGDTCYFSVHEMQCSFNEEEFEDASSSYSLEDSEEEEYDKDQHENFNKFAEEMSDIPSEIFEAMFGDHCQVKVTRNGFDVQEYEHD